MLENLLSNELFPTLLSIGIFAAFGVAVVTHRKRERARQEAFNAFAVQSGYDFDPSPAVEFSDRGALFRQGRNRKVFNVLSTTRGASTLLVFDYSYVTGGGKNRTTHLQTVSVLTRGGRNLPDFTLSPQYFFHKIGAYFGYQDIDFPTFPKFSGQYLLRGQNEAAVRDCFREDRIERLELEPGLCLEGSGETLLVYRESVRVKPEELARWSELALELDDLFS